MHKISFDSPVLKVESSPTEVAIGLDGRVLVLSATTLEHVSFVFTVWLYCLCSFYHTAAIADFVFFLSNCRAVKALLIDQTVPMLCSICFFFFFFTRNEPITRSGSRWTVSR